MRRNTRAIDRPYRPFFIALNYYGGVNVDKLTGVKASFLTTIGVIGTTIANMLGGWDMALQTLLMFMIVDYVMGLIVAGIFHKSKKTNTGTLNSNVGWKGICKKGATLLIVLIAAQLDRMSGTDVIRTGVIIAYVANEAISIIENVGLMGVPVPEVITNAIELLKKKDDKNDN